MNVPLGAFVPVVAVIVISMAFCSSSTALIIDTSGTFEFDNDIAFLTFELFDDGPVTLLTSSWIAGDSGLGFDPYLSLWDGSGQLVLTQDDNGGTGTVSLNDVTYAYGEWDVYIDAFLEGGIYTAAITQFSNNAVGSTLAEGFVHDGDPFFTSAFGDQELFNGLWSDVDARTGDYGFHVVNADRVVDPGVPVPEPATLMLFGIGGLCVALERRRHRTRT
jgi:hypothetical protein